MTWQRAFLIQAQSDLRIYRLLLNSPGVEQCHPLHYLQMGCEKLAKAFLCDAQSDTPPKQSHAALTNLLRMIQTDPNIRIYLKYKRRSQFQKFIQSLLPIARQIQNLAPSLAGQSGPNPEYPWKPPNKPDVIVPAQHSFSALHQDGRNREQLIALIEALTQYFDK